MNLSFSSRGWPELSWEEMQELAIDMGFHGIEVYNLHKNPALCDRGGAFHPYQIAATVRHLREKKLHIPCFDTSWDISESDHSWLAALMETAKDARVPYVTAVALTKEQADKLSAKLSALTGKKIDLTNRVDPGILGGVRLDYDGKRLDDTVSHRLDSVRNMLKNTVL